MKRGGGPAGRAGGADWSGVPSSDTPVSSVGRSACPVGDVGHRLPSSTATSSSFSEGAKKGRGRKPGCLQLCFFFKTSCYGFFLVSITAELKERTVYRGTTR